MLKKMKRKSSLFVILCMLASMAFLGQEVSAKAKFSVPKTIVFSFDKGNTGANEYYSNVIWISGTSNWKVASKVQSGIGSTKASGKKVISKLTPFYSENRSQMAGLGLRLKKTGTSTVTFKIKYQKKTYKMKTKVKVVKYQNPFKRIMIDGADYTSRYNNKQASNVTTWGSKYVITPNQYWKIKSVYTYQPGKKLQKVTVKNHSFTIKKNYNATITMQNTRTKVCEEINVKNPGF